MKIYWQSFVSQLNGASYLARLQEYLKALAAAGTEVEVFGMDPPDRDFGRLSELRCGIQAIDAGLRAEEAGYDAFVMGHFQDPGLYELRSALRIPAIGAGEATLLAATTLGRGIGLITLDPAFKAWHFEQAALYGISGRVTHVTGLGVTPEDFDQAFAGDDKKRDELLTILTETAMPMVDSGAEVIVPAGVLPGLLIAGEKGFRVGRAPVLSCTAVALKSAEMWGQLHACSGIEPSRGPSFALATDQSKSDFRTLVAKGAGALLVNPESQVRN
ncbi:MAG: aspartate/glutamate racemase family protein [Rhodospirillaceae bacterium]|nr:aspartate/glutamate racemase family protein [Rhodospirillaceae bacterium]